jgi:hypothetical protein
MTNVPRALRLSITIGVAVGAGAARVYYRDLPGALPTSQPSPSVAFDPLQAFKLWVADLYVGVKGFTVDKA